MELERIVCRKIKKKTMKEYFDLECETKSPYKGSTYYDMTPFSIAYAPSARDNIVRLPSGCVRLRVK